MTLASPVPLADQHDLSHFNSGVASLDDWLRRRARTNQIVGASHCYVLCDGNKVVGYYALSSSNVRVTEATGRFRRNMPDPIPVVLLGRLAIDTNYQRRGIGRALVRDAALRVLQASDVIGVRGVLVHALSAEAKEFYTAVGFEESPLDPMLLMITLEDIKTSLI